LRWARFQSNSKLHELDPRPQGRNTTRGQRQRRVSSSGNAESVRQRSGQRARNSSGTHSASGQSSSRMRTQWTARELEQDMPISSSPRFKFHGGRHIRSPGAAGPGGRHLKLQLGKVLCHRHQSQWRPARVSARCCQFSVLSRARKYRRGVRAGRPPGAPILLRVYLPTAEATKNGGAGLDL